MTKNFSSQPLPEPFRNRIHRQFSGEASGFLTALDEEPVTAVRRNPHKWKRVEDPSMSPAGSPAYLDSPVPWNRNGWYLKKRPSFTLDPLFHAGSYYVQEAASMFLEHVLLQPGIQEQCDVILDACAAPGGKATLISAGFPGSLIVANEAIRSRVPSLIENSIKWGTGNLVITQNDTRRVAELAGFFDLALVDAPCSGEGLFRKNPGSRTEWSVDNTHLCAKRQRSILTDVWQTIRPGGHLIYATCTFNPDENEQNVAWLLAQTGGECIRIPEPASGDTPANNGNMPGKKPDIHEIVTGPVTGYGFYPHRSRAEGFFLSLIRKPPAAGSTHAQRPVIRSPHIAKADSPAAKQTQLWFRDSRFNLYQIRDRLYRIQSHHHDLLHSISSLLSVRYSGTAVGRIIRDEVIPDPAAALDIRLDPSRFSQIDCTREEALRFLGREPLPVPENMEPGLQLAMYNGLPLGWLKNLGKRLNNYHPKEWRIRSVPK